MLDNSPVVFPFVAEPDMRRGRTVLRPVVRLSLGSTDLVLDALVDTGSEHVLADSSVAFASDIDLTDPLDIEEIGLGGGVAIARFVRVQAFLHLPNTDSAPVSWALDVGFIDSWRPLYPCILGNVGFLDQFTVTVSRFAQSTALESLEVFDRRFGI